MAASNKYIGFDSDGCVIDTMASKQHGFLQPLMIQAFHLEPMTETYKACADYVNLYSKTRGISRFNAILLVFETFNRHPAVRAAKFPLLPVDDLRAFVQSGLPLGNPGLTRWLADHPSQPLETLLRWSHSVNDAILASGATFPAYEGAKAALAALAGRCHTGIISQSPERVLRDDWGRQGLLDAVELVAGQELGNKVQQLTTFAGDAPRDSVLMIGDAPGDLQAARDFGCCFYPILPGQEERSWQIFNSDVREAFLEGTYTPEAQAAYLAEFAQSLPSTPPWELA